LNPIGTFKIFKTFEMPCLQGVGLRASLLEL